VEATLKESEDNRVQTIKEMDAKTTLELETIRYNIKGIAKQNPHGSLHPCGSYHLSLTAEFAPYNTRFKKIPKE
jgi:hypothetical protein